MFGPACAAGESVYRYRDGGITGHDGSLGVVASRSAGGPLCWKSFCAARGWFVTSQKGKHERNADGISANCASCLDGGVLRWSEDEEQDAVDHQIECLRRGEVISISEFATARFHPFIDVDLEKQSQPDPDSVGVKVCRIAQRELAKFLGSKSSVSHPATTAVLLSAPEKTTKGVPSYAVAADADASLPWFKKGFHVVFPDVVVSVHEWRQLLAAVAFACDADASMERLPSVASPWFKSIDVGCGPNLRAPFSDKKVACGKCATRRKHAIAQRKMDSKTHVKRPRADSHVHENQGPVDPAGADADVDGVSTTERYVLDDKEALRMLRELVTPEGKHRNSASKCDDPHCIDGYTPENRPYAVLSVVSPSGEIDDVMTQRLKKYPRRAYQMSTIRAVGAKSTRPAFRVYEGAPAIDDALKRAGKAPLWSHPAAGTSGRGRAGNSKLVAVTDVHTIQQMLKAIRDVHPCFDGVIPDRVLANARRNYYVMYTTGEFSRYCLNLQSGRFGEVADGNEKDRGGVVSRPSFPGMHRSDKKAYFYFSARTGTVCQKCKCVCDALEARVSGKTCKQFVSSGRALSVELKTLLFGEQSAQQQQQQQKQRGQGQGSSGFILSKPVKSSMSTESMLVRFSEVVEHAGGNTDTSFSIRSTRSDGSLSIISDSTWTPVQKLARGTDTTNEDSDDPLDRTLDSNSDTNVGLSIHDFRDGIDDDVLATRNTPAKRARANTPRGDKHSAALAQPRATQPQHPGKRLPAQFNVLDMILKRSAAAAATTTAAAAATPAPSGVQKTQTR